MPDKRKTKDAICKFCNKSFISHHRFATVWTEYCSECSKKRVWYAQKVNSQNAR